MTPPTLSIVIMNWNGLARLKRCLPAVLRSSWPQTEFIIINNGSTDGSADWAERRLVASGRPHTVLRSPENLGTSRGRNQGARAATGKYIWFLDNDIEPAPDAGSRLVRFMERHPEVWTSMPVLRDGADRQRLFISGGSFAPYGIHHRRNANLRGRDPNRLPRAFPIAFTCGAMMMRRDWWERSGGFDPIATLWLDDYDFGARTWVCGGRAAILTTAVVWHHDDAPRDYHTRGDFVWREEFRGGVMFVLKNFQPRTVATMLPLLLARQLYQNLKRMIHGDPGFPLRVWLPALASLGAPEVARHVLAQRRRIQAMRRRPDLAFLGRL